MRIWIILLTSCALAACNQAEAVSGKHSSAGKTPDDIFPKSGNYHVIHDGIGAAGENREESDTWLDVSDRDKFKEQFVRDGGSRCRDQSVELGGGSFSVKMTCDAPDGDIHNIGMESHGTYSRDSIDVTNDVTLWGSPMRETYSYRLIGR
jgi:hypothetical protein